MSRPALAAPEPRGPRPGRAADPNSSRSPPLEKVGPGPPQMDPRSPCRPGGQLRALRPRRRAWPALKALWTSGRLRTISRRGPSRCTAATGPRTGPGRRSGRAARHRAKWGPDWSMEWARDRRPGHRPPAGRTRPAAPGRGPVPPPAARPRPRPTRSAAVDRSGTSTTPGGGGSEPAGSARTTSKGGPTGVGQVGCGRSHQGHGERVAGSGRAAGRGPDARPVPEIDHQEGATDGSAHSSIRRGSDRRVRTSVGVRTSGGGTGRGPSEPTVATGRP